MQKALWTLSAVTVMVISLAQAPPCPAQAFGGGESERGLRPEGTYVPYDGKPLMERYHYETGSYLFFNQDPRTLYWADYYDRLDRALRFGYRIPNPPCFPNAQGLHEPRFGIGFGLYRWR